MATKYDAIIIGTGQSGPSLATTLAGAGRNVAIIERHLFGGTCVNTGCIPTKTLVASARAAYVAKNGKDFGVVVDGLHVLEELNLEDVQTVVIVELQIINLVKDKLVL